MKLIASFKKKIDKVDISKKNHFFNDSLEIFYKRNKKNEIKSKDYLSDKKLLDKYYKSSTKYYDRYLKLISYKLNKLHELNYPKKYWEIILGYWLIKFIQSVYPIYLEKKFLSKKFKFNEIYFSEENIDVLINVNTGLCKKKLKKSGLIKW